MRDLLRRAWRFGTRTPPATAALQDPEDPETWYGLDYVHDRIAAQLQQQSRLWEEADGRLRLILGVIGVIFAATLGLLPRGTITVSTPGGPVQEPLLLPTGVGALAVAAIGLYALAAVVAAVAYWLRTLSLPPEPPALRRYITTDEREIWIQLFVIDEMLNAYATNGVDLERKVRLFHWGFVLATAATAALGTGVILDVLLLTRPWGT